MPKVLCTSLTAAACWLLLPALLPAQCSSACTTGSYPGVDGPAQYVICLPQPTSCYNGNVVLFAHGFVPAGSPAGAWQSQLALPDGTTLPALVNGLGFGFAASGFSKDGLAVLQGIEDTKRLLDLYRTTVPANRAFVTGASEGGLIAAKAAELMGGTYAAGLAACGPIGSFQKQLNYFGDVRVLFDYFFPGVLTTGTPGESAINIPPALMLNWSAVYEPKIRRAVRSNFWGTLQLLSTADIPIGLNFANAEDAIVGTLWYNVFGTNDAKATLGGNPFDNINTKYRGSFNDTRLNTHVARFAADPAALNSVTSYETTGLLGVPLVTLHNLADPIVPFWHEALYAVKAKAAGSSSRLLQIPILRYGHCQFNATEMRSAFILMLLKAR